MPVAAAAIHYVLAGANGRTTAVADTTRRYEVNQRVPTWAKHAGLVHKSRRQHRGSKRRHARLTGAWQLPGDWGLAA